MTMTTTYANETTVPGAYDSFTVVVIGDNGRMETQSEWEHDGGNIEVAVTVALAQAIARLGMGEPLVAVHYHNA